MDFGSKFVYNYSDSEEEFVSDEEFDDGMNPYLPISGSVSASAPPPPPVAAAAAPGGGAAASKKKSGKLFGLFSSKARASAPTAASAGPPKPQKSRHWLSSSRSQDQAPTYQHVQCRKWRRADTNVVVVKFDQLTAPSNMHTGDPVYCRGCEGVLSRISKLSGDGDERVWTCEFCGDPNPVDIVDEEIPKDENVTFMLSPAPTTTASGRSGTDESLVIFCVDTSGSMCVTTEVPGRVRLRGDHLERLQSLNDTRESQYIPGQSKNVTYVSRLQGVQAAVDHQLGAMATEHPDRRVALVAFNTEVTIVGDGSKDPVHFSGGKLSNFEELSKAGTELALPSSIKSTRRALGNKVFDLEEGGQTALGPALLLSISMACQVPGSKVIICTDGLANVGLGGLDGIDRDEIYAEATGFFTKVSQMAVEKGVSVSVISIEGTDCKMAELGKVADTTGGQVNIVDPMKLTEEFGEILADPIIATNVSASLLLHKGLYFRDDESELSLMTRQIGNVTKDTEFTFEFGVRKEAKRAKKKPASTILEEGSAEYDNPPKPTPVFDNPVYHGTEKQPEEKMETDQPPGEQVYDNAPGSSTSGAQAQAGPSKAPPCIDGLTELPFQLRIEYTDLEGARALRVLTQFKPITRDRALAEDEINIPAISAHTAQTSARWALEGKYTASRMNAFMNQRLLHRQTTKGARHRELYENFYDNVCDMEHAVGAMQRREADHYGSRLSDCESDDDDEEAACSLTSAAVAGSPSSKQPKKKKYLRKKTVSEKTQRQRTRDCADVEATVLYNVKNMSSNAFK